MSVKISVPANEVKDRGKSPLILDNEQRCSRCNQSPADFFEVHRVQYRIGLKHNPLFGNKYRISKDYRLKLSVCETCYKSDFLTHPELLDRNKSPLSTIARSHSTAWAIGGLLAGCGFVLLTPIIPQSGFLSTIKQMWQIPVALGVVILLITWFSQKKYQERVLNEIQDANPNFQPLPRADVHINVLDDEKDPNAIALEILLKNEEWAVACAQKKHLKFEMTSTPEDETLSKG